MRLHHLVVATLLAVSATAAEEGKISDLRLGFYGMGTDGTKDSELTVTSTGAVLSSGTSSGDLDSHSRVSLSYVGGEAKPVGMVFGIGLAIDMADYEWTNGDTQTWTGVIVDLNLGAAVTLGSNLHLEAAGVLGIGAGTVEYDVAAYDVDPADAVVVEWGFRLGAYGTLEGLQVGLETGWMSTNYVGAEWEIVGANQTYSEDTEIAGAYIGLTLGARL